jgi:hypothetical protein
MSRWMIAGFVSLAVAGGAMGAELSPPASEWRS